MENAAQEQTQTRPSEARFAASGDFASKVYQDEPIRVAAAQAENYTPPQYRAMRKIAGRAYHEPNAKIFYEQGKFMEDFEDDFDFRGEFSQYFPTYQSMNDRQLRGYFSWRTRVRHGAIEKTSLSFAFVYLYELINRVGVRSPEEGFHTLKNFRAAYREIDFRIDRYAKLWLQDYVVYNNLDKSLLEDFSDANFNNAALTLLDYKSRGADEIFSALNSLSSYDMEKSRLFRQYPQDVKGVVQSVFSALSDEDDKNCNGALREKLFGKIYISSYPMFSSAVFYSPIRPKDFIYEVNGLCKYTCKDGAWSCERFFCRKGNNRQIGALLKAVDFLMRSRYNFRPALKADKTTQMLWDVIDRAIEDYREKQKEAARPKVEIDVSKLQNIRKAALETQEKLLVEEPEEALAEISNKKDAPPQDTGLSDTEYLFVRCLLYGRAYDGLVRSKGLPLSVLVDAVNENFFDRFGDTVIVESDGRPELVADYIEELKEIIRE